MKNSYLLTYLLLIIFFSSCQKEIEINTIVEENISTRSGSDICNNLISNGDFEDLFCLNGLNAMNPDLTGNPCTRPWVCYYGSPDLVSWVWDWGNTASAALDPYWASFDALGNSMAFVTTGIHTEHSEGFTQRLGSEISTTYTTDPNSTYCFSADVASTTWDQNINNGNLTLHVQLDSALPRECSLNQESTEPICNPTAFCFDIQIPDNYEYPNWFNFSIDLPEGISESDIYLWSDTDITGTSSFTPRGIFVDNISLTCTNKKVIGITATDLEQCEYAFSPDMSPGVTIVDILWDFGDGSTSTITNPTHTYIDFGNYEVTMTITDSNGCCTTKTTIVDCKDPICDYYACWAWGNEPSIQIFKRLEGFTLIDENNVTQTIKLFTPHIPANGGYAQFYDAMKNYLIVNHGFTLAQFKETDPAIDCNKQGEPTVGFFICQSSIKLVSIDGFQDWGGTIQDHLDFLVKDCE